MLQRVLREAACWVLLWLAALGAARLLLAAVDCVGGCNEVQALYQVNVVEGKTYNCLAYSATPNAHNLIQVKTNLGGQPKLVDTINTRKWYCNDCIEPCNPPLDPESRELEPPDEFKDCQPGDAIQRSRCVEKKQYGPY